MSGLGIRHAGYKWLKSPESSRELQERELAEKLHELHAEDAEGGHRVLTGDLEDLGYQCQNAEYGGYATERESAR